ncbi:hypothetical protein FQN51_005713 [Onygenales sp. PD_10]|nr:hypothetical protein FQN51_005713 [Onygenales sp. PD_10]
MCSYPEDARRSSRLTKAEIEALRKEVSEYRRLHKGYQEQISTPDTERALPSPSDSGDQLTQHAPGSTQDGSTHEIQSQFRTRPFGSHDANVQYRYPAAAQDPFPSPQEDTQGELEESEGPSCDETRIAGAVADGGNVHVHGLTSVLHQPLAGNSLSEKSVSPEDHKVHIQRVKDQLFSNAALQRQREINLYGYPERSIGTPIDLDGVDPEMAKHLLDLHWNRQHLAYLLSYRPAIIDSMFNHGPYVNKLLLNAIYFSSSLYSDRTVLQEDPKDPQSMGRRFYRRFKELLVDEIDRPSLPTLVALLLCGASLVSNGAQSAGWILCGTAYRMITDLGCHLSIQSPGDQYGSKSQLTSMEIEMRTRAYWGAFLTDKFQSLYLGRPSALRRGEARVPRVLLDSHEELESWSPYIDPETNLRSPLPTYQPRPAYAVSTFLALVSLGEIASAIACRLYRFVTLKTPPDELLKIKSDIETDLEAWIKNLPAHLQFDPTTDPTPPPHQITPHTTYCTLIILLYRPFLCNGHLASLSDPTLQKYGEEKCKYAALRIWHLIDAYKRAFTLRRAPYLLSYAAYSAILVILTQTRVDNGQYLECIEFFWYTLLDLQRGCNFGLGRPMKILQSLMERLGQEIPGWDPRNCTATQVASLRQQTNNIGRPYDPPVPLAPDNCNIPLADLPAIDFLFHQGANPENVPEEWINNLMNNQNLMDGSIFGLFTPDQTNTLF